MTSPLHPTFDLATAVATRGVAANAAAVDQLVAAARRAGVRHALVTTLADPSQPDIVRMRALGRVLAELDHVAPARHLAAA